MTEQSREYDSYLSIRATVSREAAYAGVPVKPGCPRCWGIGRLRTDVGRGDPEFGKLVECPTCSEPAKRDWLEAQCGLEGPLLEKLLYGWVGGNWTGRDDADILVEQRRAALRAMRSAVKDRVGLYTWWGEYGSGKTRALATVCNELRQVMTETYYVQMAAVLDHLKSLYSRKVDTSDYWRRLLEVPVLALDEVTRVNPTDWARERIFLLIDTRYNRRRSHLTLFGSNEEPVRSQEGYFGYLFSRMTEGVMVEMSGDFRPAAAEAWAQRKDVE